MWEQILLGTIQGVVEWLPVSSEGILFLVKSNIWGENELKSLLETALLLHLGTFLAALVYFRKRVWALVRALIHYRTATEDNRRILVFLLIATLISGTLGYGMVVLMEGFSGGMDITSDVITLGIGILLLITAILQYRAQKGNREEVLYKNSLKEYSGIKKRDGILLGVVQSFAALPGLSRSGLTVSALLLRKFDDNIALELSFLLSLPIVLGGNIVLNWDKLSVSPLAWAGLAFSFVFGLLTIDLLLRLARKVNFAHFVLFFGVLTIIAGVI